MSSTIVAIHIFVSWVSSSAVPARRMTVHHDILQVISRQPIYKQYNMNDTNGIAEIVCNWTSAKSRMCVFSMFFTMLIAS